MLPLSDWDGVVELWGKVGKGPSTANGEVWSVELDSGGIMTTWEMFDLSVLVDWDRGTSSDTR